MSKLKKLDERKIKYCLFSNIAFLNAKTLLEKNTNKPLTEGNLKNNLIDKETGKSFFVNTNLYLFLLKNIKKNENDNNRDNKDINERVNDIFKLIVEHLNKMRNLYSHKNPKHNENQHKYENSQKELYEGQLKQVVKKSSKTPIFNKFEDKEWDIFIIQIFLYKNEWNEFRTFLEAEKIIKLPSDTFLRRYKMNLRTHLLRPQIYLEIINYLKNFHGVKNRKKVFIKCALKLLRYYFGNNKNDFTIQWDNNLKRGLVINISFLKKQKKVCLNFQGIRQLLLYLALDPKKTISYNLFLERENNNKDIEVSQEKKYEIFRKRLAKKSRIDETHLLKLFNKALMRTDISKDQFKFGLGQTLFNQLRQFFQQNNKSYINLGHDTTKAIIKILKIEEEQIENVDYWKDTIKNFILKNIKRETYNKIFPTAKEKNSAPNDDNVIWKENPKLFTVKVKNHSTNKKENIYSPLFDFKNSWSIEDNNIKQFIAPILLFFYKKTQTVSQKEAKNNEFVEDLFTEEEAEDSLVKMETIQKVFKERIINSKANLVKYEDKDIHISSNLFYSEYETLHSKLFQEVYALLGKKGESVPNVEEDVLPRIKHYLKNENNLIQWALDNEDTKNAKYRDYIMHRSLSKMQSWDVLDKFIEDVNNKNNKKYESDHNSSSPSNRNNTNQDLELEIANFDEKMKSN